MDSYKTFDPSGYTVLCQLDKTCDGLVYFSKTAKVVLNVGEQGKILYNFQSFIPNVAKDLVISENEAVEANPGFFVGKSVVVLREITL